MTTDQQHRLTVTPEGDREYTTERIFDAPRDRVFALWTDPELIPQWWGPEKYTTVVDYVDFTTGGRWRFVSTDDEGHEFAFQGAFREVTPPKRIVQSFEWEGMPGHVSIDTLDFEDLGDGRTRLRGRTTFHTEQERDGMLGSGMEGGLAETYDRLERLLAQ